MSLKINPADIQTADDFIQALVKSRQVVDREAPILWLPHPTKKGQFVVAVPVINTAVSAQLAQFDQRYWQK